MVTLALQDRLSQDKHIELVNIIGNPGAGMLTRAMAKELVATSTYECLFVDFLSEEEPKKVSGALHHPVPKSKSISGACQLLGAKMSSGVDLIRRIQGIGYGVLEFLGVGTTFDIFKNILFPYSLNTAYCLSWIRRIRLVSFVVFGECRHGYTVSSLMDTAYW
ncbi:hypothetical protein Tco_0735450 [Tanacetum coccineum]